MNGTVHFAQNLIAFIILASTSPVTYSIASLIKRVAVICIAIVWFNQTVHPVQALGIAMTVGGLYMYNTAKADVQRGEIQMHRVEAARGLVLPSNRAEAQSRLQRADLIPVVLYPNGTFDVGFSIKGIPIQPPLQDHAPRRIPSLAIQRHSPDH